MRNRKLLESEEKRIVAYLDKEMKKQGISHYQLAKEAKISRNTFANAVKGISHPTLITIMCVAEYLNVDMKDLFKK